MDLSKNIDGVTRSLADQKCSQCLNSVRSKRREFSAAAWSSLGDWHEVITSERNSPMCDSCYHDLRAILIERSDEVAEYSNPAPGFEGEQPSQVA